MNITPAHLLVIVKTPSFLAHAAELNNRGSELTIYVILDTDLRNILLNS